MLNLYICIRFFYIKYCTIIKTNEITTIAIDTIVVFYWFYFQEILLVNLSLHLIVLFHHHVFGLIALILHLFSPWNPTPLYIKKVVFYNIYFLFLKVPMLSHILYLYLFAQQTVYHVLTFLSLS